MKALIVEGGALRTVFSTGVLDAFIVNGFDPFDIYIGVSGGAMCMSYYFTGQYRAAYNIVQHIANDPQFMGLKNLLSTEGFLNLSYLFEFSESNFPFQIDKAIQKKKNKTIEIVATNLQDAKPVYLWPNKQNWIPCLKASGTLPFISKGFFPFGKLKLTDGGWSDPIPAKRALQLGADQIVVVRSQPLQYRSEWRYLGMLGKLLHRDKPNIQVLFNNEYRMYNKCLDFLNKEHPIQVIQIAPPDYLKTTAYSTSVEKMNIDYRTGLDMAIQFLHQHRADFL